MESKQSSTRSQGMAMFLLLCSKITRSVLVFISRYSNFLICFRNLQARIKCGPVCAQYVRGVSLYLSSWCLNCFAHMRTSESLVSHLQNRQLWCCYPAQLDETSKVFQSSATPIEFIICSVSQIGPHCWMYPSHGRAVHVYYSGSPGIDGILISMESNSYGDGLCFTST